MKTTNGAFAGDTEMARRMREFSWAESAVGPVEKWPPSLKTALGILLASGYPMYIAWGESFTQFYNDAYRPILGATKHPAALGQSTPECFAEIWDFIGPMFRRVMETGEATTLVDQFLPLERNGYAEECYFTFSYSAILDESGAPGGVFVTVIETTMQLIGERRLRTLQELGARTGGAKQVGAACALSAEALAGDPHDLPFALIYMFEEDGSRASLCGAAGLPEGGPAGPAEIILAEAAADQGWPLEQSMPPEGIILDDVRRRIGEVHAGAWPEPIETAVVLPIVLPGLEKVAGFLVAGVSSRRRIDEEYRHFYRLVAEQVGTAISRARAYETEQKRAESLAELDRAKTTFFSNISHELRTPLTLMLGPVEDILSKPDGQVLPENRELATVAHRSGRRLLKLVNTLLDFSRLEAGRVETSYEPVDLAAYTADLASGFRSAVEKAGLRLVVDTPPLAEPAFVDREMWEKIVLNLLSNAFKFTFAGEINVSLRQIGERIELAVADTGVGIPAAERLRIFDRFHRVRDARSRTNEGTGIGLALVQELARLHGGEVQVESEEDRGTTFTVNIRAGSSHLPKDRIGTSRRLDSTATGAASFVEEALGWLPDAGDLNSNGEGVEGPPFRKNGNGSLPRILLADDNADMRRYVRRLLREHYEVIAVPDGEAALESVIAERPDLVITDVMMPRLDGFGLLRELRGDPATRDIPVILLSARAGEEARVEGIEQGADDYLIKPFNARDLLARVKTLLDRRQANERLRESEQHFRLLFEQAVDGIFVADVEGRYVDVNTAACEMLGYTREELLSFTISELIAPGEVPLLPQEVERFANGAIATSQWHLRRKDGSYLVGELVGRQLPNGQLQAIVRDVTDRNAAEQKLRDSEERYRTLFNSMDEGFCVIEMIFDEDEKPVDYRFLATNPAFSRQTGLPEVKGRRMREIAPELEQHWFDIYGKVALTGEATRFENCAAALQRWFEVYAFRLETSDKCRVGIVFNDITARKRNEEALRESRAALDFTLESAQVGDWDLDLTTDTARRSLRHDQCFGYHEPVAQWGYAQFIQHVHPDDRARVEQDYRSAIIESKPWRFECRVIWPDGSLHWIGVHGSVYLTKDGKPTRMLGIVANITERKQTDDELIRFNRVAVDRELRIIELKKEVNGLCKRVAEAARYPLEFEENDNKNTFA